MNERRQKLVNTYYENKIKGAELLIDNVWDPHNVAAVSRSADALGIEKINLYYTYNQLPELKRLGHKSSASATRWMPFEEVGNLDEFVSKKKADGYRFYAAHKTDHSTDLRRVDFPEKFIIMMGSESKGVSKELLEIADEVITIPMIGMVESYNISVAAALILYQVFLQRGGEVHVDALRDLRGERM